MKYEGKRPSGVDPDVDVYTFSIGSQELEILFGMAEACKKHTPRTTETQTMHARMSNIVKTLGEIMWDNHIGRHRLDKPVKRPQSRMNNGRNIRPVRTEEASEGGAEAGTEPSL